MEGVLVWGSSGSTDRISALPEPMPGSNRGTRSSRTADDTGSRSWQAGGRRQPSTRGCRRRSREAPRRAKRARWRDDSGREVPGRIGAESLSTASGVLSVQPPKREAYRPEVSECAPRAGSLPSLPDGGPGSGSTRLSVRRSREALRRAVVPVLDAQLAGDVTAANEDGLAFGEGVVVDVPAELPAALSTAAHGYYSASLGP